MSHQQHFLTTFAAYQALVNTLPLAGRTVLDIGMGHGEVTRLLLAAGAEHVIGFEIDPSLPDVADPRVEVIIGDIRQQEDAAVVSNPPYDLLPYLLDLFERKRIEDVVLMTPPSKVPAGFTTVFELGVHAFDPPATGRHLVIKKGFGL